MNRGQGVKGSRGHVHSLTLFLTLLLLVSLTRFPFRTKILYDWDSVQFALGMRHFDVSLFQPHPPGYFFYVMSARAVNFFVHDENTSLVLLSILGSAIALYFTFLLGLRMFSKEVAVAATALLFTSPLFWMFGLIGNPDIFDATFSAWFAYLAWRVLKGEHHLMPWASLFLGIATGFRTGLLIFLGPMWVHAMFSSTRKIRTFAVNALVMLFAMTMWLIPAVSLSGGIQKYRQGFLEASQSFLETSIFQAGLTGLLKNFFNMAASVLFSGLCTFSVIFLSLIPVFFMLTVPSFRNLHRTNYFLILIWVIPAMLFLAVIHFGSFAFGLFFLPPLFLSSVKVLRDFSCEISKKNLRIPPFVYTVLPTFLFIFLNGMISSASLPQFIKKNNLNWKERKNSILTKPSSETLILASFKQSKANYFRHVMYYLPEYKVVFIPGISAKYPAKKAVIGYNGKAEAVALKLAGNYNEIAIPQKTRYVGIIDPYLMRWCGKDLSVCFLDAKGKKVIRYKYGFFELR